MRTADKHSKIIDAAIKVFSRKGFYNARISDIAKEAQVADGTIYLYFNNKYDILISLFEEEIGKIILEVKLLIEQESDPREMLRLFALHHLRLMEEKRELAEVLQMELRQCNKFMREYRNTKFIEYVDIVSAIVRKGVEMRMFRANVLPGVFKRAFFGALDETARLWVLSPDHSYTIDEAAAQISAIFLEGILLER
ncbi:MAG: TetR/AcrR family transcriptional regulator [Thermodesulfobacteriota bacterium]